MGRLFKVTSCKIKYLLVFIKPIHRVPITSWLTECALACEVYKFTGATTSAFYKGDVGIYKPGAYFIELTPSRPHLVGRKTKKRNFFILLSKFKPKTQFESSWMWREPSVASVSFGTVSQQDRQKKTHFCGLILSEVPLPFDKHIDSFWSSFFPKSARKIDFEVWFKLSSSRFAW